MDEDTASVEVQGLVTIRTYHDGSVQRNVWASEEEAQHYAASITDPTGTAARIAVQTFISETAQTNPAMAEALSQIAGQIAPAVDPAPAPAPEPAPVDPAPQPGA